MLIRKIVVFILVGFISLKSFAQICTGLGQNPSTAFPVCGTSTFTQASVPSCGGKVLPAVCGTTKLTDINPYWYKFTCFRTGTLIFVIAPNTPSEDYDWQLFDVTNRNPADVYTDASLIVACNWSGEPGNTGADEFVLAARGAQGIKGTPAQRHHVVGHVLDPVLAQQRTPGRHHALASIGDALLDHFRRAAIDPVAIGQIRIALAAAGVR